MRDYAQVYVDDVLKGTLDRRLGEDSMPIVVPAHARLSILVENSGRVNFARPLRYEEKGITHRVTLAGRELTGWNVYTFPMRDLSELDCQVTGAVECQRSIRMMSFEPMQTAGFYVGAFDLTRTGDTFLDMRDWGKGTVWVNGHQLGRFWGIGPEQTLYVPGPWLRAGRNDVVVFDLLAPEHSTLQGLDHPILDDLRPNDRSH